MKAVIITQEEPFYIPLFLQKVLEQYGEIAAIITLPGVPQGFTLFSYIKRLYEVFRLKDFIVYAALFLHHKLLNLLSTFHQFSRFYSVQRAGKKHSVPVYRLRDINAPESLHILKTLSPELIISVAAPQVFKKDVIRSARHVINIHAALLPEYRGMMPSFWVLAKGEPKTGVTVHYINEHIDTGDIICQKTIDISPRDTLHSLQTRVASEGSVALLEALEDIKEGNVLGVRPEGSGTYYSFPSGEGAREFRRRGRKFI